MTPALLVRLDAALLAGMSWEDRARVVEMAERAPEEWELERPPVGVLVMNTASGRLTIQAHPFCADGTWLALTGANAYSLAFEGPATLAQIRDEVFALEVDQAPIRHALLAPRDWASINAETAVLRRFDANYAFPWSR